MRAAQQVPAFRERFTSRGIAYTVSGRGEPVVLIHGWCLERTLWTYLEEQLASRALVICPDLPGFGASSGLAGPYDLDRYAEELAAFIAELSLSRAIVCGFAFGAMVAMATAARDHSHIRSLVLIGVPSAAHSPYARMPRAMRRDWPVFSERSARAICKQPQSEATIAWLAQMFRSTPLSVAIETVKIMEQFEPEALAPSVRVPAVFVHGAEDDVVPLSVIERCAAKMAEARVEVVKDCGHLVVLDQKDRLAEILTAALIAADA